MAIELDTSQPLRRPADLRQLVDAIAIAGPADEAHWVEWKSSLRLDALDGWFSISKQILGFANRHPDRAARFAGGLGYVVVGAEPGTVSGITPVDVAQLDDWLRVYLGNDGPAWSPTYVTVNDVEVLVVVVEPPRWGDRIFLLRKTYQPPKGGGGADKGTVFIRREAKTERANDVEHDMLQDRLLRGQRQPGLELTLGWKDGPVALTPIAATAELRRAWLDKRQEVLLRSLTEPVKQPQASTDKRLAVSPSRPLSEAFINATRREDRTPDQYRQEVEEHLEEASRELPVCSWPTGWLGPGRTPSAWWPAIPRTGTYPRSRWCCTCRDGSGRSTRTTSPTTIGRSPSCQRLLAGTAPCGRRSGSEAGPGSAAWPVCRSTPPTSGRQ